MQLAALFGIGAICALIVFIFNKLSLRRRHAVLAKQLSCQPVHGKLTWDESGIMSLVKGMQASKAKVFPDFVKEQFERLNEENGRVVSTMRINTIFFSSLFFTAEPANIQALLALQFKDFGFGVNRTENFKNLLGNGIFAANGKQWEHSRALLRPQFVRSQVSDLDLEENHVQAMMKVIDRHTGADSWTGTVDLQVLFFRLTLDSATEFLFGESVNSQAERTIQPFGTGKDDGSFAFAFDRAQYQLSTAARLGKNYWMGHTPELRRMTKRVHEFVDYFVQKAIQHTPDEKEKNEKKGYVFLEALAEETQDAVELRSQLLNILLAGRDTTASLLGWFFLTMADTRYKHIYRRLRAIILEQFGTYDNPTEISFERMKACQYLQWCINEALRLYPVVPMNVRTAMKDTTLPRGGGLDGMSPIFVPKGTDIAYSVYVMHRRKDLWGADADEFRPERWESRKPGWDYLPFNGGPRICIGQQFALTETAYVIIRLMQRVDDLDGSALGPIRHGLTLTNCPANGVRVRMHCVN